MDITDVLHKTGDADSRDENKSQVQVEHFIISYTSTCIRLPHLSPGYQNHCLVTAYDGSMRRVGCG